MVKYPAWAVLSAVMSCVLAVYSLFDGMDLCFFALEVIALVALTLPYTAHLGYTYAPSIHKASFAVPAAMMVMIAIGQLVDPAFFHERFWNTSLFTYLMESLQVTQAFVAGLMFMSVLSHTGGFRITKRWMVLASMFVALGYGVLCMFGYFIGMYFAGDNVFNIVGGYVAQEYNALMMSTCFIATIVSAIVAFVVVRMTRGMDVDDFITRGDGRE